MKKVAAIFVCLGCCYGVFLAPPAAHAESMRIAPLEYQTYLKKGEKKKGFVDVTNASNEAVNLKLYVDGFRQVDDKGNLTFFDDEQVSKGIELDYDSIALGPEQTLRLFFVADGTKLPTGDVFGVIFAETEPAGQPGTSTSVRVGTLVMITNQTPGPRTAEIENLNLPFLQIGDSINGQMLVKNPAPKGQVTGFTPDVGIELSPWGGKLESKGPLIFAGNARTASFSLPSSQFGIYRAKVYANNAEEYRYVFLMTGVWRLLVPVIILGVASSIVIVRNYWLPRRMAAQKLRGKKLSKD